MIFAIKNHLGPTLLATVVIVGISVALKHLLGLEWNLAFGPDTFKHAALGLAAIGTSDTLLHGSLWLVLRKRYFERHEELADYFRPQGPLEIFGGGILACAEELFFRGILVQVLLQIGAAGAVAISATIFGLLHLIPRRPRLRPYVIWAIWEGALLGGVYLWSGSLLVSMLVHGAHDIIGFSFFALQRRVMDEKK